MLTNPDEKVAALVPRIKALVPAHPEILTMDAPEPLFDVPGFEWRDLEVTPDQVSEALAKVQSTFQIRFLAEGS
jgi:hypothetical protein